MVPSNADLNIVGAIRFAFWFFSWALVVYAAFSF
jgi:hypothetical protein